MNFLIGSIFLTKYQSIDADIFSKVARTLVSKSAEDTNYARPLAYIYNKYSDIFGQWFDIFESDMTLAFDAYLAAFNVDTHFDYSGEALDLLTLRDKNFLLKFVDSVYKKERWPSSYTNIPKLEFLWQRDSYIEDVEQYATYIFEKEKGSGDNIFKILFLKEKGNTDAEELTLKKRNFIKQTISNNITNLDYVYFIFDVANLMDEDFRRNLLGLFVEENKNFDAFQKIEYTWSSKSWSGSRVPILEKEKTFLVTLLPMFSSVDFLEHKAYIENQIEHKIKNIEHEKKRDFLESR